MDFLALLFLVYSFGIEDTAYGLRCFQENSDDADYEPTPNDAVTCPSGTTECVSGFIDTEKQKVPDQQAIFACDTEDLCQAVGNNSCEYDETSMTCCCDTDLCNNGRKYVSQPPSSTIPKSSFFLKALLPTFVLLPFIAI